MNPWQDCYAPLVGRIFMGGFFVWSGVAAALNLPLLQQTLSAHGVPELFALAIITIEVVCGLLLVIGLESSLMALILALYLIIRMVFVTNFADDIELNRMVVNLALVGGLLYISAYGGGLWVVRHRRRS